MKLPQLQPLVHGEMGPPLALSKIPRFQQLKIERQARLERKWLLEEDPFPRPPFWFDRSLNFLLRQFHHETKKDEVKVVADLGCGKGEVTKRLLQLGMEVDAVDIASNALKHLKSYETSKLRLLQEALPRTLLPDTAYDAVVALDLIGELEEEEYRLFFSELARIGKRGSLAVVSTPLDLTTQCGMERFLSLFSTEYEIQEIEFGYLRFQTKWSGVTKTLESVRKFLLAERGITHIIASGKRKALC